MLEDRLTPATIVVTTHADVVARDGQRSLREAITRANATDELDIIVLGPGVYSISREGAFEDGNTSGDFDISKPLRIQGAGARSTFIDAASLDRVFQVFGQIDMTFSGVTIRNGFSPILLGGGGIYALGARLTLNHSTVSGNLGLSGGGIFAIGPVTLNHSAVTGNVASSTGGGISKLGGLLTLKSSVVSGNVASGAGGGINISDRSFVTLTGSTVRGNVASEEGGGINTDIGQVTLTNSTVSGNVAGTDGGGIDVDTGGIGPDAGFVALIHSSVNNNVAASSGGGISGFDVSLDHSTVTRNLSSALGGGIFVGDGFQGGLGDVLLTGSSVSHNVAEMGGGGIYHSFFHGSVTLTDSTVSGNVARDATADGGGLFVNRVAVSINSSAIRRNRAGDAGGGMSSGGETTIFLSTVSENTAQAGGGLFMDADLDLLQSTLQGNRAFSAGGGLLVSRGTTDLRNVTLSGNTAVGFGAGGGLFNQGTVSLVNVTATRNAAVAGGGVFNNGTASVVNTIIAQNRATGGAAAGPDMRGAFISEGHNLIGIVDGSSGWNPSAGDLLGTAAAPLDPGLEPLADNGGPTLTHALRTGSPAIDHVDEGRSPLFDQRGILRPRDGNGDGSQLGDIGAFEK